MEDIKNIVVDVLNQVVQKAHTHPSKMKIRVHNGSIAIACPYCGDSAKNPREKRGHFFLDSLKFYCYNEQCTSNIIKLINDFDIDLDLDKRMVISETISEIKENPTYVRKTHIDFSDIDKLIPLEEILNKLNGEDYWLTNVTKPKKGSFGWEYLTKRGIDPTHPMFYEGYRWEGHGGERVIIFFNIMDKDKVVSLQVRGIDKKSPRNYKVHVWSDIMSRLYGSLGSNPETEHYDKLSLYFGLGFINPAYPITIFEGFLDSTLSPNSIGLTGAGIDASPLEELGLVLRYFYDNPYKDSTGKIMSEKRLHENKSVFLWKKFIDEISSGDKKKELILKGSKDLNDIEIALGKDCYHKYNMEKYFSVDEFDIMWI